MLHLSLPASNTNKSMDLPHAHVFYPGTIPLPQLCKSCHHTRHSRVLNRKKFPVMKWKEKRASGTQSNGLKTRSNRHTRAARRGGDRRYGRRHACQLLGLVINIVLPHEQGGQVAQVRGVTVRLLCL